MVSGLLPITTYVLRPTQQVDGLRICSRLPPTSYVLPNKYMVSGLLPITTQVLPFHFMYLSLKNPVESCETS